MVSTSKSLLKAILYADLFAFPLSKEELWMFAIEGKFASRTAFEKAVKKLSGSIAQKDGYFFLKGREDLVTVRKKRAAMSKKKLELARILSVYLSYIPTVQFIGVSGGVAMENADEGDDIDFFVIAHKNTLWVTRFFCLLLLQILGRRRKRDGKIVADMLCLNMLLDEGSLAIPDAKRDLYAAHEIVQLHPLFSRGDAYERFLLANSWLDRFLPHAAERIRGYTYKKRPQTKSKFLRVLTHPRMVQLTKLLQLIYMKKREKDIRSTSMLAFYPSHYHEIILREYAKKLKEFGLSQYERAKI